MVHCNIYLENNDRGVYYAGQVLKGELTKKIQLDLKIKIKKVNSYF